MAFAWNHLDSQDVLDSYAKAAIAKLSIKREQPYVDRETAFKVFFSADADKRQLVIETILPLAVEGDADTALITSRIRDSLSPNDFSWLIETLQNVDQENILKVLVKLVLSAFNRQDSEQESVLESVARQCQPLREELELRQQRGKQH